MEIGNFLTWFGAIGLIAGFAVATMLWAYSGSGSVAVRFEQPIPVPDAPPLEPTGLEARDRLQQGIDQFQQRNYRQAVECFNAALQLDQSLAEAFHNRGLAQANLRQDNEAVRSLAIAADLYLQQENPAAAAVIKQNFEVLQRNPETGPST